MFLTVSCVLLSILLRTTSAGSTVNKPNVLFVIFDDLRPALSGYGDKLAKTPNLDRFMQNSFSFSKAYCQQALCAPSRNSMLTGRRPDTLHLYDFYSYWRTFAGNFTTLPQYFKNNGYHTYSIGKVFHPGISSNFTDDCPFSWSQRSFHPPTETFMNAPVCPDNSGALHKNLICPVRPKLQPGHSLPDIQSTDEAVKFLKEYNNATKPYFLAVGFHKPHVPFRFPRKFLNDFPRNKFNTTSEEKPKEMPDVAWNPFTDIRGRDDSKKLHIPFPFGPIPHEFQTSIRQAYYTAVGYVDFLFGKLLKHIDFNNTIVVVTGDHGWSLGEHGEWAKFSNFEVAVRVPLIIYSPEFKMIQSKKFDEIVELVDLFPTLVDLASLPKLKTCTNRKEVTCAEGNSLYNLLKSGNSKSHRWALNQYPRPGKYPTEHPNSDKPKLHEIKVMGYSIRTKNFRYTMWIPFNPQKFTKDWKNPYAEELYDHRIDTAENFNLNTNPDYEIVRKKLQGRLIRSNNKL